MKMDWTHVLIMAWFVIAMTPLLLLISLIQILLTPLEYLNKILPKAWRKIKEKINL